jgi:hypothetical protein
MKSIPREDVEMIIYTAECWSVIIKRTYKTINRIMEDEDYRQELVIAGIEAYRKWMSTPGNSRENMHIYRKGKKTLLSYIVGAMKFETGKIVQLSDYDKRKTNTQDKVHLTDSDPREDLNHEFYNEGWMVRLGETDGGYAEFEMDNLIDSLSLSKKDKKILKAIIREAPASFLGLEQSGISLFDLSKSTGHSQMVLRKTLRSLSRKSEVRKLVAS